ncbi:evolutionarily conserved signaling intermediate in Toll pathway, mitochondrial [Vidua chalybeata]|uniref:evolutionarily conserved signaling intermediate in Toll pathway, mitochondrial n=1 Tax=Vidua chalybeata TaxID=81927 RepID=UPI0023A84C26|nr:evolutionarily conserved signaling intermediate in Toll pathway, mitochondrial [Vidua chalybeata]
MRPGWLRGLPRGLWGGPAAPQLCRRLCQRPARVPPAESDTSAGGGDTAGTSARHRRFHKIWENEPQPRDHPGSPVGGDTSGGDTRKAALRRLRSRGSHREDARGGGGGGGADPGGPGDRGDPGAAFEAALRELSRSPPGRGGRLALVEAALAALPALGAERSLAAYNALLRLLPRGAWVPRGAVQRLLFPFPRQQECGLSLLEHMERYGVMPDAETQFLLLGVFGPRSRPMRKLQRMLFWLPRLRLLDPHPLPPRLPPGLAAARLGLQRIATEPGATLTLVQRPVPDSGDDEGSVQPYIISSQSPEQRELLAQHGPARPVFVEGPFPLWLRGTLLKYFVLRGDPLPPHLRDPPADPERSFYFPLRLELELERGPWDDDAFHVDQVEEGPVLALCVAGAGDRRTLGRWLAALQERNPALARTPVVFRLAPGGDPAAHPPEGTQPPRLAAGTPAPAAALGQDGGDAPKSSGE